MDKTVRQVKRADLREVPEYEVPGPGVVRLGLVHRRLVKVDRHDLHPVLGGKKRVTTDLLDSRAGQWTPP